MIRPQTSWIKLISEEEGKELIGLLTDSETPGEKIPQGLFLWQEEDKWIGLDNLDYYAWTDEFELQSDAEDWLTDWTCWSSMYDD